MFWRFVCYKNTNIIFSENVRCQNFIKVCLSSSSILNDRKYTNNANTSFKKNYDHSNKLYGDPDVFGNYNINSEQDTGDLKETNYVQEPPMRSQQLPIKKYAEMIKSLIKKRKIKEAIDIFEERMLKQDRVKPDKYIYSLLIAACGEVGYTKKAFMLFNDMKKRGVKPAGGIYTSLFNACANSPWENDGLVRATKLKELMKEKMYEPNDKNYNVMIKAFGRCGDLGTAFYLVDEMLHKSLNVNEETLNFLLQACISDKEAGFRHALLVWQKFFQLNISPSIYSYNLMLRSIRDCGLGNSDESQNLLLELISEKQKCLETIDCNKILISNNCNNKLLSISDFKLNISEKNKSPLQYEPNLMARNPYLGNMISIGEITKAEERLLLVGGLSGFLKHMIENKVSPDIKTFSQLLEVIPNTTAAENELLNYMKKQNIIADIDFLNMLIKKRSMRFDYEGAKKVLKIMDQNRYIPNLITYGVLALGCRTKEEALDLLNKMDESKYRINIEILGAMLQQACFHVNFSYVIELLNICEQKHIKPNIKFMEHLENFKRKCRNISNNHENELNKSTSFQNGFKLFRRKYEVWCMENKLDDNETIHPWQQFRENNDSETANKYIDKKSRFKKKTSSKYSAKSFSNHKNTKGKTVRNEPKENNEVWCMENKLDDNETIHPWQQFRENNDSETANKYKNKKSRFTKKSSSKYSAKSFSNHKNTKGKTVRKEPKENNEVWCMENKLDDNETTHPWQQFRENNDSETANKYIDKKSRFTKKSSSKYLAKSFNNHKNIKGKTIK